MGVQEKFEQHWLVVIMVVVVASVGATWAVLNQVLVRPRDEEFERFKRHMEELETRRQVSSSSTDVTSADVASNPRNSGEGTDKPENQADSARLRSVPQGETVGSAQPPKQESHGPNSPNIFQKGSGSIDVRINDSVKPPSYDEPNDKEMREAFLDQIKKRGAVVKDSNTFATENMLAGISIEIVEFEKLGCNVASQGAGYFCTYRTVLKPRFYSTEGTEAGDAHARGVAMLMKFIMGGDTSTETATRRFTKAVGGWVVSAE
jgi:hypothetical protein